MRKSLLYVGGFLFVISFALLLPPRGLSEGENGSAAKGQKLFQQDCNMCHYPDKTEKKIGPGLKGLFKNKVLPMSKKPVTVANVRHQIESGSPTKGMPAFGSKLKPADVADLIAYLKTL